MTRPYPDDIQAAVAAANREGREVSLDSSQLAELGHQKRSLNKVIRRFCLQCMGDNAAEVRRCTSPGCPLWPYRLGKNPYRAKRSGFSGAALSAQFQPERGEETENTTRPTREPLKLRTKADVAKKFSLPRGSKEYPL